MKHGPIALLDDKFPILYLLSSNKNTVLKEITNLYEAHTRSKRIILFATTKSIKMIDHKFLSEINGEVDMVIGIRSFQQRASEYIFSYYARLFYGIEDPLCGIKAYKMKIYDLLGHFDSYG